MSLRTFNEKKKNSVSALIEKYAKWAVSENGATYSEVSFNNSSSAMCWHETHSNEFSLVIKDFSTSSFRFVHSAIFSRSLSRTQLHVSFAPMMMKPKRDEKSQKMRLCTWNFERKLFLKVDLFIARTHKSNEAAEEKFRHDWALSIVKKLLTHIFPSASSSLVGMFRVELAKILRFN